MIDFTKSKQYTLSIRLSTDGFSFSVFNPLVDSEPPYYDREVDESLSLTANLKQTFREVEWLNRPFRRVNVLSADKRHTFIPLEFFEDEQAETVFYHNHPKQENEIVQYNILAKNNIKKVELLEYPELGMEAIWKIEVEDFPAFILVDDKGNDFFKQLKPWNCSK